MDKRVVANEILLEDAAALMEEGREVTLRPLGSSMLPFIREDVDRVVLRKKDSYAVGDIVLAHFGGRYILHRIVALDGDAVTLTDLSAENMNVIVKAEKININGTVIVPEGFPKTLKTIQDLGYPTVVINNSE